MTSQWAAPQRQGIANAGRLKSERRYTEIPA